ncbi:phosphoglycolate phosphatase [Spirochaetia bacterium]|nr:phosphoglycolate phosphatase [Spirochaetia bacterium]
MRFKCVIFDLDGTLADTIGDIAASMNRALAERAFPLLAEEEYPEKLGWGIKKLAFLALPEEKRDEKTVEDLAARASRFYAEEPLNKTKAYPGIRELLAELKRRKIKLAVITNKPDALAQTVVEGLFPGIFDDVRGVLPNRPAKPDPALVWDLLFDLGCSPRQALIVGDSEVDLETSRRAECPAIAVSWGFRPRKVLEEAGANYFADTPEDILKLVSETKM